MSGWAIRFTEKSLKQINKLDLPIRRRIFNYLDKVVSSASPLASSEPLTGLPGKRKFRIGDYRILFTAQHQQLTILVLKVGHRSHVYKNTTDL